MRNLKRALSLALASVMLLGMMVVGTSAASYPDVDENDNVEAIEVLNAVNVMIGDRGNFRPDAAVNRHEMAVIMAKLVLGNDVADNYVGSHPFTDTFPWADKYVAACYENGIVSGTSKTTFSGNQPLTAVQAAAMMLNALGYKDLNKGADDWRAPLVAMANQLRLFNGVTSNPSQQLNRNQVAQLVLNTLKSPVVDLKDGTFNIADGNGQIIVTGGNREYIVRSSLDAYAKAISDVEQRGNSASGVGGYTIELGEHLYNGKLRLEDTTDDFGRPARYWEYDGSGIGTYMKEELVRKEYVGKVTSADLYSLLGASALKNNELAVYIDGVADSAVNPAVFDVSDLSRTNTKAVGATGNGVLTQVFVDSSEELITVAITNTYLAEATANYSEKKASLSLKTYNVDVDAKNNVVKKAADDSVTAYSEDFPLVESAEKGDFFLVTLACGVVQSIVEAPTVEDVTLNSFKEKDSVTGGGVTYEYATTARYDTDVLNKYDDNNMKKTVYKLYLDQYDNLIGIEIVEEELNYVFIAGVEAFGSVLGKSNADAFAIFPDGTSKTITVKDAGNVTTAGGTKWSTKADDGALWNQWYTYTTDKNGLYTLGRIEYTLGTNRVAQGFNDASAAAITIDKSHVSLKGTTDGERAYGNDDTIYMLVKQSENSKGTPVISGVDTMTVGVANADITVYKASDGVPGGFHGCSYLYNDKGYIIAAVAEGEDNGNEKDYAFILDSKPKQEDYDDDADEWTWYRKAIVNGEEVELKEKGSALTYLGKDSGNGNMGQYKWFRVSYDKDGYVVGTSAKDNSSATWNDKTAVKFTNTNSKENIYLSATRHFNSLSNIVQDDVALVQQVMTTSDANWGLTLDGFTLYAYDNRDTYDTGIHLKRDANAVLIETNVDNDRVIRYFDDGDGHDNVDATLNAMKKDANGKNKFNGTVYYVMKDGEATTIIIVDNDAQTSQGIQGPSNGKVARMIYGTQPADIGPHIWAADKDGNGVSGAVVSLYILKDEGYVKVGDFTTNASGDTPTLPTIAGNNYKAVCGSVEYLFAT